MCTFVMASSKGFDNLTGTENRVGGKRSSFLPTFVFRPLTPPYMRFRRGHAGQVDGPGSSRNDGNGLQLARADFSDEPDAVL